MKRLSTKGAAMILFVLFFAFASTAMVFVLSSSIFSDLSDFTRLTQSKQAFLASESITEDVVYRRIFGTFSVDTTESLTVGGVTASAVTTYDSPLDAFFIDSEAQVGEVIRKSSAELEIGAGSAFNYGLQAGNGGVDLSQSARIIGNIYSNGPVTGFNESDVLGDVVSAGATGLVDEIHATGSIYAHTISNSYIEGDAYYTVDGGGNTIDGTSNPGWPDQPPVDYPISTTTVQEWKDSITDIEDVTDPTSVCFGGGPYVVNIDMTIGYIKYECDIEINGNNTDVYMTGPVWVAGNLSFTNGPNIHVDSSVGRRSTQFIVDNPSDRLTSSQVSIQQSTSFSGSGDDRSFVLVMSLNESAALGGSEIAIDISNQGTGEFLTYAASGTVDIGQNIEISEITAYQINVSNNTDIIYEEGLASLVFTSGPGGAYVLEDWQQAE